MSYWEERVQPLRWEAHFGDRIIRCFGDRPDSVNAMLAAALETNPDGEALVAGDDRWTYRQLDEVVGRIAAGLTAMGIAGADRVAMMLGNRPEFVFSFYAILRIGAVAVPLSTRYQTPEITYAVNQCGAVMLIHEASLSDRLPAPADVPKLRLRIEVGGQPNRDGAFPILLGHGTREPAPTEAEQAAVILYTSGTTGRPKGAMLTHLGLVHSSLVWRECMKLTASDRTVVAAPVAHVAALSANVLAMLACSGTAILLAQFKAEDFLRLAERERMTHTLMVPAMYNICLRHPDFDRYDLSRWRIGAYGGSSMPVPTIEQIGAKLPKLDLMNAYGATETTSPTTIMPASRTADKLESIGLPVPGIHILILDDAGREVPVGEPGELWIGGANIVRGYWDNPSADTENFTAGYWHSGDIGSIDEEGFVYVFDRKKDMIDRGGLKVFSAEVESALMGHPAVIEAAVVSKPSAILGERVHAFVVLSGEAVAAEDLASFCAERLSNYKVPETFTIRPDPLPRNANGKVIKNVLRQELQKLIEAGTVAAGE